jgi:nucleotide-binding universal stress UspA family protein
MPPIQTILHPTDFSENSRPASETASALARDYQTTLIALHVMIPWRGFGATHAQTSMILVRG